MPFCTANGLTIPVELDSWSHSFTAFAEHDRPFNNQPRVHRSGVTEQVSFRTVCLSQADADSIVAIFERAGSHHWSFDADAWSDRGLGPEAGATYTLTAGGYAGATNRLTVTTAGIVYNPRLRADKHTISYARTSDGGTTWEFVTVRSDGKKWIDGVNNDAADTSELLVSNGGVLLTSAFDYGEVSFLGAKLSDDHIVELFTHVSGGGQFRRKHVVIGGDCVLADSDAVSVVDGQDVIQKGGGFTPGAGWENNARHVRVSLAIMELM